MAEIGLPVLCIHCLPLLSRITVSRINFTKYLQSKGMAPRNQSSKQQRRSPNFLVFGFILLTSWILEGLSETRRGRVRKMEGANLGCYLWSREKLWLSYGFSPRVKQLQISRGSPWKELSRRNHQVSFLNEIKASVHLVISCSISLHPWRSSLWCNLRTVINQILVRVSKLSIVTCLLL